MQYNINMNVCFRNDIGSRCLLHNNVKTDILMHRWRYPSLSLHGIEGFKITYFYKDSYLIN